MTFVTLWVIHKKNPLFRENFSCADMTSAQTYVIPDPQDADRDLEDDMYYCVGSKIVFGATNPDGQPTAEHDWTFGFATNPDPIVELLNNAVRRNREGHYTESARMIRRAETMCDRINLLHD